MGNTERDALAARVAIQSIALQELVRVLAPAQVQQFANGLRRRVGDMFSSGDAVSAEVDEAVASELAALLAAGEPI